jgi:hypothetical protein
MNSIISPKTYIIKTNILQINHIKMKATFIRNFIPIIILFGIIFSLAESNAQVHREWVARYNFYMTQTGDAGYEVAVDINGNVYVGGQSGNVGTLVKYNSSGVEQWTKQTIMEIRGVLIDPNGSIDLAGIYDGTSYDYYFLEKFRISDGYKLWE